MTQGLSESPSSSALSGEERIAFDMYFASLCSMQVHPGAGTKEHRKLTLDECKGLALDMIQIRRLAMEG